MQMLLRNSKGSILMLQTDLELLPGPGDDSWMVLSQDLGLDYQFMPFILFRLPFHSQSSLLLSLPWNKKLYTVSSSPHFPGGSIQAFLSPRQCKKRKKKCTL